MCGGGGVSICDNLTKRRGGIGIYDLLKGEGGANCRKLHEGLCHV